MSVIQCTPDTSLPMTIKAINAAIAIVTHRLNTLFLIRARSCIIEFRLSYVSHMLSFFILCILNRCTPQKPRCHKASGLFCTHFLQCNFNRCQSPKSPCGWDMNLNNRLFKGEFCDFLIAESPFFSIFLKEAAHGIYGTASR